MDNHKKKYWKGVQQLAKDPAYLKHADKEFASTGMEVDPAHSRRDFLRTMGFGVAAASLAACETPIRKAIPYVNKPVDVDSSIPNYYASTYSSGGDCLSVVVKTREGRPIKIEGNAHSLITRGGVNAQAEASVLSLYDDYRLRHPLKQKTASSWGDVDKEIKEQLKDIAAQGKGIRIVSQTINSPSIRKAINVFKEKYPTTKHIQYDPVSYYGMRKANEMSFGESFIPSYNFAKVAVIVSISADFLGSWLCPTSIASDYASTRRVREDKRNMSKHYQFEANLSMTGSNADYRSMVLPSQEPHIVVQLYNWIARKAGRETVEGGIENIRHLEEAADELWQNRGKALVVAGSNDASVQLMVNAINDMLGSYGTTIDSRPLHYRNGDDEEMIAFVDEVKEGKLGAIIFYSCNPVYDHFMGETLGRSLPNVPLTVSTSYVEDETAVASTYKAPDHHYLESWNDYEPVARSYSFSQPAITPLFKTRSAAESLLTWSHQPQEYFVFLKNNWRDWFEEEGERGDFQEFWDRNLYNGVLNASYEPDSLSFFGNVATSSEAIRQQYEVAVSGFEIVFYENTTMGNGVHANNPLLQELPDPVTKAVWDHYATIAQKDAQKLGIFNDAEGHTQYLDIKVGKKNFKIPALVQPGQMPGTIGIALGYGRKNVGRVGENIGINVYPFLVYAYQTISYTVSQGVSVKKNNDSYQIAQTQIHQTYMGRSSIIQEARLDEFKQNPSAGREFPKITEWNKKVDPADISLWKGHQYKDHHWGMSIDLNTCTGCSACVVACNVENNVPVVGKEEVLMRREMHWLRIDRYYSSEAEEISNYEAMEKAAENPEVVFQPMLCQHCNNAPCETVCPVAATTHSSEGLNQMTYNRCIGTRYCANNCPYKVRRFNWFKYHNNRQFERVNPSMNSELTRMVLNPDVTVRSRGVMEKCSFCVQRIQTGKLEAKREKRPMKDGDVVTACEVACTTGAIVFGDLNDEDSRISKLLKVKKNKKNPYSPDKHIGNPRAYRVLEEIGVKPNIFYLTKIKNKA